jgi:HEAT repeat protein
MAAQFEDAALRARVAEVMATSLSEAFTSDLIDDGDVETGEYLATVVALGQIGIRLEDEVARTHVMEALLEILRWLDYRHMWNRNLYIQVVLAVARLGNLRSVEALVAALGEERDFVWEAAAQALAKIGEAPENSPVVM